jgi:hypothetical protein
MNFALKGIDGKIYTLANVRGPKRTLIVFICNHCPYVKASIGRIVTEAKALREIGIGTITIMPNDTDTNHEDSFDNMKEFAAEHGFTFPTLSTRRRTWREPMALNACPTSSASTRKMNCNIAGGSTRRAYSLRHMFAATCSKQ